MVFFTDGLQPIAVISMFLKLYNQCIKNLYVNNIFYSSSLSFFFDLRGQKERYCAIFFDFSKEMSDALILTPQRLLQELVWGLFLPFASLKGGKYHFAPQQLTLQNSFLRGVSGCL